MASHSEVFTSWHLSANLADSYMNCGRAGTQWPRDYLSAWETSQLYLITLLQHWTPRYDNAQYCLLPYLPSLLHAHLLQLIASLHSTRTSLTRQSRPR